VPAPRSVVDALTEAQVTTAAGQPSGFQLTFQVGKTSALTSLFVLPGGAPVPVMRIVLSVSLNGAPVVISDGVVTSQQYTPGHGGNPGTLTVTGRDLSALMDLLDLRGFPFPGLPDSLQALAIIGKYAALGIVPAVVPAFQIDVEPFISAIKGQQGSDLEHLNFLARNVGYVFYIEPGPTPGANVAYFGPEVRVGDVQSALTADMDPGTNVESLSFQFDGESRTQIVAYIQEPFTKLSIPIPIPDVSVLNPPLGLVPTPARRVEQLDTAQLNPIQALLRGLSAQARTADTVTASGTLDVLRYGRPLKARRLVGVRGASDPFNGLYFVKSVTHSIKLGEYKQSFSLVRGGLKPSTPSVPI
jgi:hypothetical protein